jgi:GntR family transcriptional regulator
MGSPGEKVIPLYSRVESVIRRKILSGEFKPGKKLPTEAEFVSQFAVSKITVRYAPSRLAAKGLITRNRGRGTYVREKIPVTRQFLFTGIHDIVQALEGRKVRPLEIKKMKVGETRIARGLHDFFGLSNQDEIHCIRRISPLGKNPASYFENYMPENIARQFTKKGILQKSSLIKILKEKIGLADLQGEIKLEAIPADLDIARILQCQAFDPASFGRTATSPYRIFETRGPQV